MYGCALPLHGSTFRTGAFGASTLHYPDGNKVTLLSDERGTNDRSFKRPKALLAETTGRARGYGVQRSSVGGGDPVKVNVARLEADEVSAPSIG